MISFLSSPYPCNYGHPRSLIIAAAVGCFVTIFLFVFKPFGIDNGDLPFFYYLGYGAITFIGIVLVHFCGPYIFSGYFEEKGYTIGKEIILNGIMILIIGTGNAFFENFIVGRTALDDILLMIFNTFLIGIFPLTFMTLVEYTRKLKQNLQISEEISLPSTSHTAELRPTPAPQSIELTPNDKRQAIETDSLLYIEAVGNYANVVEMREGALSRNLVRTTLKALEEANTAPGILRCHRSYLVNLNKVQEVKGNAQGLKLHLTGCEDIVPVSRKFIQAVRAYFKT